MPDYAADLPLWHHGWWELGLSRDLLNALADWQEQFDGNFDPSKGWSSDAVMREWARNGEQLADRLRRELPHGYTLDVDLWPLDSD